METNKLKKLKVFAYVMYVINMTAFALTSVATLTCIYFAMVMPAVVSFVPAVINAVAVVLLDTLHDAVEQELDEREEKTPINNIVSLFPAKTLYDKAEVRRKQAMRKNKKEMSR